jgi:hypothetical protein
MEFFFINIQLSTSSVPSLKMAQPLFLNPNPFSQKPGKSSCLPCRLKNGGVVGQKRKFPATSTRPV